MILTDEQLVEALTDADHADIAEALTAKLEAAGQDAPADAPKPKPATKAAASIGDRMRAAAG